MQKLTCVLRNSATSKAEHERKPILHFDEASQYNNTLEVHEYIRDLDVKFSVQNKPASQDKAEKIHP